jgi:hypothetical protein
MFIERNVFRLKFGAARQALPMWKAYLEQAHRADPKIKARLFTDLTGPGYTIVLELAYETYEELEPKRCLLTQQAGWAKFYSDFIPFCDAVERTLYKLEAAY